MSVELQKAIEDFGRTFEEFKNATGEQFENVKTHGVELSDLKDKVEKINDELGEVADLKQRLDRAEAMASTLKNMVDPNEVPRECYDHEDAFDDWLRNPRDSKVVAQKNQAAQAEAEAIARLPGSLKRRYKSALGGYIEYGKIHENDRKKTITITTTGGGHAIPTLVHQRILERIRNMGGMRSVAYVTQVGNETTRFLDIDKDASGGWVAAGGTRTATGTPTFYPVTPTFGTAYAYPQVQEEAMNDIDFDVTDFVERVSGDILAAQEGAAFITGNGTARPTGILNGGSVSPLTIVSTADDASPRRAFGSIQYYPTGAAASFQSDMVGAPSPLPDPTAVLVNTVYGIRAEYRARANWMSNKATLALIRQLRNANGDMLWQAGLAAGQPNTLLGYPIAEDENMPNVGANAYPMAFGDFQRAYVVADIINTLKITIDDNITAPGFVKFYVRRRLGGILWDDDAVKIVKCATS